jgi:hypothetical protein
MGYRFNQLVKVLCGLTIAAHGFLQAGIEQKELNEISEILQRRDEIISEQIIDNTFYSQKNLSEYAKKLGVELPSDWKQGYGPKSASPADTHALHGMHNQGSNLQQIKSDPLQVQSIISDLYNPSSSELEEMSREDLIRRSLELDPFKTSTEALENGYNCIFGDEKSREAKKTVDETIAAKSGTPASITGDPPIPTAKPKTVEGETLPALTPSENIEKNKQNTVGQENLWQKPSAGGKSSKEELPAPKVEPKDLYLRNNQAKHTNNSKENGKSSTRTTAPTTTEGNNPNLQPDSRNTYLRNGGKINSKNNDDTRGTNNEKASGQIEGTNNEKLEGLNKGTTNENADNQSKEPTKKEPDDQSKEPTKKKPDDQSKEPTKKEPDDLSKEPTKKEPDDLSKEPTNKKPDDLSKEPTNGKADDLNKGPNKDDIHR